ncbi:MAG: hypothetical protein AAGC46_04375 [Solirubrobacteraceae bacterium]|nr:hypothetical protein [Patulibacter sp.]
MSRVDFFSSSDRSELAEELGQAFDELGLDDVQKIEPTPAEALLSVRFIDDVAEPDLAARAEALQVTLASLLTGGPDLTFEVVAT